MTTDLTRAATAGRTSGSSAPDAPVADRAYQRARRHSSRVRALKVMLPIVAVLTAGAFFGYTYLIAPSGISMDLVGSGFDDGKLVMANPKLQGFTKDNLPYSMHAVRATQDVANDRLIALESIAARLPVSPETFASIGAARGVYDRDADTLEISSEMTVTTTDGLEARLRSARIDLGAGTLATGEPVEIALPGTAISAQSMSVSGEGKVFVFEGAVRVRIEREKTTRVSQAGNDDGQ